MSSSPGSRRPRSAGIFGWLLRPSESQTDSRASSDEGRGGLSASEPRGTPSPPPVAWHFADDARLGWACGRQHCRGCGGTGRRCHPGAPRGSDLLV
jgi:hypothetical protein